MLGKTISQTGKTSDVRYITLSDKGSHEGMDGNVRHVHERPNREVPLDRSIDYDQFQLPQVGFELYSTSDRMLAVCVTCLKWASACPTR